MPDDDEIHGPSATKKKITRSSPTPDEDPKASITRKKQPLNSDVTVNSKASVRSIRSGGKKQKKKKTSENSEAIANNAVKKKIHPKKHQPTSLAVGSAQKKAAQAPNPKPESTSHTDIKRKPSVPTLQPRKRPSSPRLRKSPLTLPAQNDASGTDAKPKRRLPPTPRGVPRHNSLPPISAEEDRQSLSSFRKKVGGMLGMSGNSEIAPRGTPRSTPKSTPKNSPLTYRKKPASMVLRQDPSLTNGSGSVRGQGVNKAQSMMNIQRKPSSKKQIRRGPDSRSISMDGSEQHRKIPRGSGKGPDDGLQSPPGRKSSRSVGKSNHRSVSRSPKPRRGMKRSKSGDLECLANSSMHDRTDLPTSVLRNSGHTGILKNSSHHGPTIKTPSGHRPHFPRPPPISLSDEEHDSLGDNSIEEVSIVFDDEPEPIQSRSSRPGLGARLALGAKHVSRLGLSKKKSLMDLSAHSAMSFEREVSFEGDPKWKTALRYLRILPPHQDEKPENRRIRTYVWCTLTLDFIAAMVSVTTYNGVTTCCEQPIFSISFVDINWSQIMRVTTYIYIALIFLEIIPVVRKGIPFNIVNPMIGFAITFSMFFDDRIFEAIAMWVIEVAAIFFEFLTYRIQSRIYHRRYDRLDLIERDLSHYTSRRNLNPTSSRHSRSLSTSSKSDDDNSVSSGGSFGADDVEIQVDSSAGMPTMGVSMSGITGDHKLRKVRLLRERRILRQRQQSDRNHLRYHFGGVVLNFSLMCISLVLIVVIASSGGLCVKSDERPVIFDMQQLEKCNDCRGNIINGRCEICREDGQNVCYFQYI